MTRRIRTIFGIWLALSLIPVLGFASQQPDSDHSNAFTIWKQMGSPSPPSASENIKLESAGQLHLLTSPAWTELQQGELRLHLTLPRQGLSLLRVAW